jgi:DNA-binding NarL/FixJ family response regulator
MVILPPASAREQSPQPMGAEPCPEKSGHTFAARFPDQCCRRGTAGAIGGTTVASVCRTHSAGTRRRQAQGQAKARRKANTEAAPEGTERNDAIARMLAAGQSWTAIQNATGCSRATVLKIARRIKQAA